MKAIQTGNVFRIYDNSMKTYEQLPPQVYLVNFDERSGFFLTIYQDIDIKGKIYGVHQEKVNKVLTAFTKFERSLGVILSGDKGIGKSLFAKLLSAKAVNEYKMPLIIVNTYIPGIGEYLNAIEQEVVVLFDEFDKTFARSDKHDPQAEMLTLFDGIAQGKKLFVVTCNETNNLNAFLVNRPGRFHYHFRFGYPSAEDIREYLSDQISECYYGEIDKVVSFAKKVNLNYDCLRSIAFELECGDSFEEAIKDLNIMNMDDEKFTVILRLKSGEQFKRVAYLDMFSTEEESILFSIGYDDVFRAKFIPVNCAWYNHLNTNAIDGEQVNLEIDPTLPSENETLYNKYKDAEVDYIAFYRQNKKNLHYALQKVKTILLVLGIICAVLSVVDFCVGNTFAGTMCLISAILDIGLWIEDRQQK